MANTPDKQLQIFLTNTLAAAAQNEPLPWLPALTDETKMASAIKESPILVIVGNPPYSAASKNRGIWITKLIEDYKQLDGKPLGERNTKWLQDDYVKFIRFAQHKMERVERGIVAVITNHGFLDNPTFRGMRQSLMQTFDQLYFLDLHGNANKKERAPDRGKDENVFDIRQGVCISLMVKGPSIAKGVFHHDLYGTRQGKYRFCTEQSLQSTKWQEVKPETPFYIFSPGWIKDEQYNSSPSIPDIFEAKVSGIVASGDELAFGFERQEFKDKLARLATTPYRQIKERFHLKRLNNPLRIKQIQDDLVNSDLSEQNITAIRYRPFDVRCTYYTGKLGGFLANPRSKVMRHLLVGDNLGLIVSRSATGQASWQDVQVSDKIIEFGVMSTRPGNSAPIHPLYLYNNEHGNLVKTENLHAKFRQWINTHYGEHLPPEEIFGYIYAVLHSPHYRSRFAPLLRMDFPRIPFAPDVATFRNLAAIGTQLIQAHLLKCVPASKVQLQGDGDSTRVELVRYDKATQRLYINRSVWFEPVFPAVFHFRMGGYLPLDKYLKSRQGRTLTHLETETLRSAASAIGYTIAQMHEIDKHTAFMGG